MKKSSSNIVHMLEVHVEKALLAVIALLGAYVAWTYLVNTPNKVTFENRALTAAELNSEVLRSAQDLERKIKSAQAEPVAIEDYSTRLQKGFEGGIFASTAKDAPRIPPTLPLATLPGREKIVIPGAEAEEASAPVALVTPNAPSRPVVMTGRSLVKYEPAVISIETSSEAPRPTDDLEPQEKAWVTIAGWYDKPGQQQAMLDAKYARERAKAYVTRVEVQRQEKLASGQWTEWQDVPRTRAMPELLLPGVELDAGGAVKNANDISKAFQTVKERQADLSQPSFTAVEGDEWSTPPLPGLDADDAVNSARAAELAEARKKRFDEIKKARQQAGRTGVPAPVLPGPGGRGRAMVGGDDVAGGGRGFAPTGVGGAGSSEARKEQERLKREARKSLAEAQKAYSKKDYHAAADACNQVLSNPQATLPAIAKALEIQDQVTLKLEKLGAAAPAAAPAAGGGRFAPPAGGGRVMVGGDAVGDGDVVMPGGRFVGGGRGAMVAEMMPTRPAQTLITKPGSEQVAVWFHDDTVEAGKTYRYRMRVNLWNRYVGRTKAVVNPADATRTEIVGAWSEPSDPITVTPETYFFVNGPVAGKSGAAGLDVWRWREGKWLKERFNVEVGDVIGGVKKVKVGVDDEGKDERADVDFTTGAVVLDLRFDEEVNERLAGKEGFKTTKRKSLVLTYLDPADGQVKQRVQAFDQGDPLRKKLEEDSEG